MNEQQLELLSIKLDAAYALLDVVRKSIGDDQLFIEMAEEVYLFGAEDEENERILQLCLTGK